MGYKREWWVYATARSSGHLSQVGPFKDAVKAARFIEDNRPADEWACVTMHSKSKKEG